MESPSQFLLLFHGEAKDFLGVRSDRLASLPLEPQVKLPALGSQLSRQPNCRHIMLSYKVVVHRTSPNSACLVAVVVVVVVSLAVWAEIRVSHR